MTKRSQKPIQTFPRIVLSLVILLLIIACGQLVLSVWYSVDQGNEELIGTVDSLKADLDHLIAGYKLGEVEVVDLATITTFSWQRLYIFGTYTTPFEIDAAVGRSWRENCYTEIGTSENVTLLVFTDGKTAVHCLDYPKEEGDFSFSVPPNQGGLSPQEARFTVSKTNYLIWVGDK